MDNNSILITVKIEYKNGSIDSYFESDIYVSKKIKVKELIEGIKYGFGNRRDELPHGVFDTLNNIDISNSNEKKKTYVLLLNFNGSCTYVSHDDTETLQSVGFVTSSILLFTSHDIPKSEGVPAVNNAAYKNSGVISYPNYNIVTRHIMLPDLNNIDIIPPSNPPAKQDRGLFGLLFPTMLSVLVMMLVRSFVSGSNSTSMIILSGAMGATAAITTTYNWLRQRKEYRNAISDWKKHYEDYIAKKITEIKSRQLSESSLLFEQYPDVSEMICVNGSKSVYSFKCNVFNYSENDRDFLSFRLGVSDRMKSSFEISASKKDTVYSDNTFRLHGNTAEINVGVSDGIPLSELPYTLAREYGYLPQSPFLYSLADKTALGIIEPNGNTEKTRITYSFISRILFDLCCHHSPEKLQIVIFFDDKAQRSENDRVFRPLQYLPHFRGLFENKSQFVYNHKQANLVLNELRSIVDERVSERNTPLPRILMVIFNDYGIKEHSFAGYLPTVPSEDKKEKNLLGLHFIYVKQFIELLPQYCDDIIYLDNNGRGTLEPHTVVKYTDTFDSNITEFSFDHRIAHSDNRNTINPFGNDLIRASCFLSSLNCSRIAENASMPSSIGMLEILSVKYTDADAKEMIHNAIVNKWKDSNRNDVTKTLKVPIGKNEFDNVYLDLHEKADGPHMIVAGTTGSGKTETIISYLLALCASYRPDEVNLLLVDMKGGGFVERLKYLPHVVGCVTDVSGDESGNGADYMLKRFLDSIQAEIRRRKMQFNQFGVDNIDDYIRRIRSDNIRFTDALIPHLFIVIDEFTELKRYNSEHSDVDYIGEITTIARIGRSLGLHIILISQNIEGAITEDIRINVKSRLCLKVATRTASKEMIGNDLAARPNMPGNGRAYLLVGTGSRFEYFQSAYSGFDVSGEKKELPVIITDASIGREYSCLYNSLYDNPRIRATGTGKSNNRKNTQLSALITSICDVYNDMLEDNELVKPYTVFEKPMPDKIIYDHNNGYIDLTQEKIR